MEESNCNQKALKFLILCSIIILPNKTYTQIISDNPKAEKHIYKTKGLTRLKLYVYQPVRIELDKNLPAIVFFHGGGFHERPVWQFEAQCKYLVKQGMVGILASYRTNSRIFDCIADSKSAIRWVRKHAVELGIDKNRIVAGGGSAGAYLAACTGLVKGFDENNEDMDISSVPNALVLFNPALDFPAHLKDSEVKAQSDSKKRIKRVPYHAKKLIRCLSGRAIEISPFHYIEKNAPPTIIFHGTADRSIDFNQATRFCKEMKKNMNRCEVVLYEGREHGFFLKYYGEEDFTSTMETTVKFLSKLGYISQNKQ
jgi:acetyl esterase/lipase